MNQQQEQQVNKMIAELKLTQVEQLQLDAITNQQQVCDLLGWDDLKYGTFMYNSGLNFLCFYFNGHQELIEKYHSNKYYWAWFTMNWIAREKAYCESFTELQEVSYSNRLTIYLHTHNCLHLSSELKPDFKRFSQLQKEEVCNG